MGRTELPLLDQPGPAQVDSTIDQPGRARVEAPTEEPGRAQAEAPTEELGHAQRRSLVHLLGDTRAAIVRLLKSHGERSAPELAEDLGITDVAVRKQLAVLGREGLVTERTVRQDRGRPVARYRLTPRGDELFPHRYVEMIDDLLAFIVDDRGAAGIRSFLRWRQDRQTEAYGRVVDGDDLAERLEQLADALRAAGYEAVVTATADGYRLTQTHCAVYDVAREHPEMCAHEAAMFRRVLGDVRISRRETLANGATACVCSVTANCEG
ncbi:MAG TPA: metalloregulator ArsR/SmtB family transcription factor [Nitriliruptorales bacterium]|nr:metalloregulator ArsR/SmtB family transcription factor [Nitriliruptorales bacterium]